MDEKILVIVGIVIITLACFGVVVYLGTGVEATVINYIVDAFKFTIVSLGSLATGSVLGEKRAMKKLDKKDV